MLLQCVSEAVLRHITKMSRNALGHEHVLISEDLGRGESAVFRYPMMTKKMGTFQLDIQVQLRGVLSLAQNC